MNVTMQILLNYSLINVNITGAHDETPLHIAAAQNNVAQVDLLLRHRANAMVTCFGGLYPFHVAAAKGAVDTLRYLVTPGNSGYDPVVLLESVDDENATPLHAAVYGGNAEVVGVLLENGANPLAQKNDQLTPMHLACSQGSLEILQLFLDMCTPYVISHALSLQDDHGQTPLHK